MRILFVEIDDEIVRWLYHPVRYRRSALQRQLKAKIDIIKLKRIDEVEQALESSPVDFLFFCNYWNDKCEQVEELLLKLRQRFPSTRMIYMDHFDSTSSPFFQLLPLVDLYVKKQLLHPLSRYKENYHGGNIICDYYVKHRNMSLDGWQFGSEIPAGHESKIVQGWNIGTMRSVSRAHRMPLLSGLLFPKVKKTLDLTARFAAQDSQGERYFYYNHRRDALNAAASLVDTIDVRHNADGSRISLREFNRELRASRLALSPFGWGEITDRDFRIVNARTLLVKPDMSHLKTDPDIFRDGETYAATAWDFSDLGEVCERYLAQPERISEMTQAAHDAYRAFFIPGYFESKVERIIQAASDNYRAR